MTETSTTEMTEDMRFCLEYLDQLHKDTDSDVVARALRGAQYMSMALDGLSGMLRALPVETQKQMAQDMYNMAMQEAGGNVH